MSDPIHVYVGSVWQWQHFRRVTLPDGTELRGDDARATPPPKPTSQDVVAQAVQASNDERPSRTTSE